MKRQSFWMLIVASVLMLTGCQIYDVVKDATDKEEGSIIMNDGKTYTGRVEMPNANTKNVTIETLDNQKMVLQAQNIESMVVWKKTHPDNKHVLHYLPSYWFSKKNKVKKPMWMALVESGKNINFYACSFDYTIPSDGNIKISSIQGGSIVWYGLKKGETVAQALDMSDYSKRSARKNLVEYLSDDPVLCKKLTDLEIEPGDLETIAREYNPKK